MYDVKADPHQIKNLTGNKEYLALSQKMSKLLFTWMKNTNDHPPHLRKQADIVDRISGFPMGYHEIIDFMGGKYDDN